MIRYLRILNHLGDYLMYGEIRYIWECEHLFYTGRFSDE